MLRIRRIFAYGLKLTEHRRALGKRVSNKAFFEFNREGNIESAVTLLRMCISDNHNPMAWKTDWSNEDLTSILNDCKSNEALDYIVLNGWNFKYDDANPRRLNSVWKGLPVKDGYIRIRWNILAGNSGRFQITWESNLNGRAPAGNTEWVNMPSSHQLPEWKEDEFGSIDLTDAQRTGEQMDAWGEYANSAGLGIFIVQVEADDGSSQFGIEWMTAGHVARCNSNVLTLFSEATKNLGTDGSKISSSIDYDENPIVRDANRILTNISNAIENQNEPNVLLYGPPGTGKTYHCQQLMNSFTATHYSPEDQQFGINENEGMTKCWWVTFHQSLSYEDFVIGLRPKLADDGGMRLIPRAGPLLEAMEFAKGNNGMNRSIVFIDEINRGDLSRIFGDFITFMDTDKRSVYREGRLERTKMTLPLTFPSLNVGSNRNESELITINGRDNPNGIGLDDGAYIVPPNLTIIATMNSLDRSVAPMDSAMKRRFFQINILPDPDAVEEMMEANGAPEWLIYLTQHLMNRLNDWLRRVFNNDDIQIGHSYFAKVSSIDDLVDAWERRILPLLLDLCRSTTKRDELERLLQWREDDTSWNNAMEYAENQGLSVLSQIRTWPYKSNQLIRSGEVASIEGEDMRLSFFYLICKQKGDDSTTWEEEFFEKYLESRHAPDEGLVGDLDADPAQFEVFNEAREGSSRSNRNVLFDVVGGGAQIVINEGTVISAEAEIIVPSLSTDRNQKLVDFIRAEIGDNYEVQDGDENWSLTAPITIDLPHAGEHGVRAFGHAFFALMNYCPGSHPHRLRVRRQPDEIENNRDQTEMKRIDAFDFWN